MTTAADDESTSNVLEAALLDVKNRGGKCFVPYLTGGLGDDWLDIVRAVAAAGADAIEIGIPFSDPVMDGTTIQKANDLALEQGATPHSVLSELRSAPDIGVPLVVMTYANIAFRMGYKRFAASLKASGVSGCILPDLPLEEVDEWAEASAAEGVEAVLLAAPTASTERLRRISERSRGFVYGVGLAGITGVRDKLAESAKVVASRLKSVTSKPVLVGVGVGTPEQAGDVSAVSDGVVVGSAMVALMLEGAGPGGLADSVAKFRAALDQT
ncbi:MAG: tryptophan synthase subunit alpha [Acidimicrobiaceae bacterium]|nr:tryptophan synthase subunit alpha [Acidimicrobiaceae bacterium]